MKSHAAAKHRIHPVGSRMARYVRLCQDLSRAGKRRTSKSKVLQLMGSSARSPRTYAVVRRVLAGHMISVPTTTREKDSDTEPSAAAAHKAGPQPTPKEGRRRALKKDMESINLPPFSESSMCPSARLYRLIGESRGRMSQQSVRANARMIDRYVTWCQNNTPFEEERVALLCTERPRQFISAMERIVKPNTLRNYSNALLSLLALAGTNAEFIDFFKGVKKGRNRMERASKIWATLKNDSERTARRRQRGVIRGGQFQNAPIKMILQFLCEKMDEYDKRIAAVENTPDLSISPSAVPLDCAVACVLALHGARLCTALNMTISEVNDAVPANGRHVIRIADHKTADTAGPAAVALNRGQYGLVKGLATLRASRAEKGKSTTTSVLPPLAGRACQILFRQVNEFIAERVEGVCPLTFNTVRKTIHSNEFLISAGADHSGLAAAKRSVTSYLMHGRSVASLHYSYRSAKVVAAEASCVEGVVATLAALDLVRDGAVALPEYGGKDT